MRLFADLLLLTVVVIFIVDLSGWTDTFLGLLSRFTLRQGFGPVKSFRPLTCSKCMTWWCGLAWLAISGSLTMPWVAVVALLSFLTNTLRQFMLILREALNARVQDLDDKWQHKK